MLKTFAFALTLLGLTMGTARAGQYVVGTQAVADVGTLLANAADITKATTFTLGDVVLTGNGTNDFATHPTTGSERNLGSFTLDAAHPSELSFGSAGFGRFTATLIALQSSTPGNNAVVAYTVFGNFDPGTNFPSTTFNSAESGTLTISFTQTGGPGNSISASASLAVPGTPSIPTTAAVPEPATLVAFASGLSLLGLVRLRRKSA